MSNTATEERIQLLLNLAANNSNPHEAELAQAQAEALMVKYGIDEAMLADRNRAQTEQIVKRLIAFRGTYREPWAGGYGQTLATAFGTAKSYRNLYPTWARTSKNDAELLVVGYESDVDRIESVIRSLEMQSLVALKQFWRDHPMRGSLSNMDAWKERRQFIRGFIIGAATRIRANVKTVVDDTPGSGIVLASRITKIEEHMADEDIKDMKTRPGGQGSHFASNAGHSAGMNSATGETQIGEGRLSIGS